MKKRILSLFLVAVMILSTFAIIPVTAEEANLEISSLAELQAFETAVEGGDTFKDKKVVLTADITLPTDWNGIGGTFSGTFDGQGHTITMDGHGSASGDSTDGALFIQVGDATIKNLKIDGSMVWNGTYNQSVLVNKVSATTLIENVWISVAVENGSNTVNNSGAFVGRYNHSASGNLTINGCVFDGSILCKNGADTVTGFVGHTGNNRSGHSVTVKNSVFAGKLTFRDSANTEGCAAFIGYTSAGTSSVEDCISVGTLSVVGSKSNSIAFGWRSGSTLKVKNLYYVDQKNSTTGNSLTVSQGDYTAEGVVEAMTKAEIAALTANAFSDPTQWAIGNENGVNLYYPCPAGLKPAEGWIPSLCYVTGDAAVLGAQIRCTEAGDQYSGIRFVSVFKKDKVEGAQTSGANFGIILIAKEKLDKIEGSITVDSLVAAGAINVQATSADESVEGYYRVNAVVYEIPETKYASEIVAYVYVAGELVGESVTRSIYDVAVKCAADENAAQYQRDFCQGIVDYVQDQAQA